jgi:mRNA interferase YafQ
MFEIIPSATYRKSLKKLLRGKKLRLERLEHVVQILTEGETLPVQYRDHALTGEFKGYRECHIQNDILLIYRKERNKLFLILFDVGTHAQLFG